MVQKASGNGTGNIGATMLSTEEKLDIVIDALSTLSELFEEFKANQEELIEKVANLSIIDDDDLFSGFDLN